MGNETRHYFGAYLRIETNEVEVEETVDRCKNGHPGWTPYCPYCGEQIERQTVSVRRNPTAVYDIDDSDRLASIVPQTLDGKGVIFAIANMSRAGNWLYIDQRDAEHEVLEFPTEAEIAALKEALVTEYAADIAGLRASPMVKSVEVCAGYLLDEEY